jgi:hypothetical protein
MKPALKQAKHQIIVTGNDDQVLVRQYGKRKPFFGGIVGGIVGAIFQPTQAPRPGFSTQGTPGSSKSLKAWRCDDSAPDRSR